MSAKSKIDEIKIGGFGIHRTNLHPRNGSRRQQGGFKVCYVLAMSRGAIKLMQIVSVYFKV